MSSGAGGEPPIPPSTVYEIAAARNESRRAQMSATSGRDTSVALVHPSRTADSDSASAPHSVASCAAIRLATLSATKREMVAVTAVVAAPYVTRTLTLSYLSPLREPV